MLDAASTTHSGEQAMTVSASTACMPVAGTPNDDVRHRSNAAQTPNADIIAQIRETHRQRQDLHRAEKSLTLQIKAIERRLNRLGGIDHKCCDSRKKIVGSANPTGDEVHGHPDIQPRPDDIAYFASLPLQEARALIHKNRLAPERNMAKLAKRLPVYSFVEGVHGFGAIGLAQIVGEAGDLSNYANPAKLWKRMGLAVINGKSQRRVAGAGALEHGYSPQRRSIMYCIGDSMIKKQNAYRELYLARKIVEEQKMPEGTKLHWHRRAQRYMEKRLLRDLWRAWRDETTDSV